MDGVQGGRRTRRTHFQLLLTGVAAIAAAVALASPASGVARCGNGEEGTHSADSLTGGGGDDCLSGARGDDLIRGGRGDDSLTGGPGRDQVLAGSGRDRVSAGGGNDLVSVRDGRAERVRCGPGNDLASADATDVLAGCEKVHLFAAQEEWMFFRTHINAYGKGGLFDRGGWGKCSPHQAYRATCTGRAEEGVKPFDGGAISMEWDKRADGSSGQDVTIKATDVDGTLLGYSDTGWRYLGINGGRIRQWVDPNNGVFRTGNDLSKVGKQGGPLQADLSFHNYPLESQRDGYSLDVQGWFRIIRF
jgi:RTX calcium-binding nonapeptide repeat (4 copies)